MEKMTYRGFLKRYYRSRIERYMFLIESLHAYLPILESNSQKKMNQSLEDLKVMQQKKLDHAYFLTQDPEKRLSILKEDLREKRNQKYYWTLRAIKQKRKRLEAKGDETIAHEARLMEKAALGAIENKIETALNRLSKHPSLSKPLMEKAVYEALEKTLSDAWLNHQQERLNRHQKRLNQEKVKVSKKAEIYQTRLNVLKEKLTHLEGQLLHEETERLEQLSEKKKEDPTYQAMDHAIDHLNAKLRLRENQDIHLTLSHLSMSFAGLKAVDDLSFDVKKGSIFGLIGPNGAGKTTVFNCITQFYKPTSGAIYFKNNKQEVVSLLDYPVHEIIKQGIVRTFQNVELIWELNILDNMLVGAHSLYKSSLLTQLLHLPMLKREEEVVKAKAIRILDSLGLLSYKDFYPLGLPYGILKKIELARTLMTDPQLIILDEPAAGLNDQETKALAKTIKDIQKHHGCTIFLVEHDMELVMDICDEICAINFGKKIAIGTPREIQSHPEVREAYLGGE